jgi:glycosyltransferase involved in cell wall biosynthesis
MFEGTEKKILIVSLNIPYPLTHGGAIAQYFFLKELSSIHEVTFCTHAQNSADKMRLIQLASLLPKLNVIYALDKDQKTGFFDQLRNTYHILSQKLTRKKPASDDLLELSRHNNIFILAKQFIDFFQAHLANNKYDVIQLEFFETLSLFPLLPVYSKKIFICHEIKSKKMAGLICKPENLAYKNYVVATVKEMEDAFLKLADHIVVFTEEDKDYFAASRINTTISSFGLPSELITQKNPSESFNRFLFMGNESLFPNREGLKWFLEEIYLPNENLISWPVIILGEWSKEFQETFRHPKIKFKGLVERTDPYYANSILISPILSGSGLRTKILLAFANYMPVISTRFASEGMHKKTADGEYILHFENTIEFLGHYRRFEKNESILKEVAKNARKFYEQQFSPKNLVEERNNIY